MISKLLGTAKRFFSYLQINGMLADAGTRQQGLLLLFLDVNAIQNYIID
ncbi:hypothetical protein SAMN06265218_1055 [Fodinibius sediminis]|uniref:Uncharacterized protein n=1 Tax=Fodinibius sediminis TaxID=1214077 RepID=A0A521C3W1_9BACT|nr:hypothetical protein SAMN06265218_1055 [Fodinibius sediminis]